MIIGRPPVVTWLAVVLLALAGASPPARAQLTRARPRVVIGPVRTDSLDPAAMAIALATEDALPEKLSVVPQFRLTGSREFKRDCGESLGTVQKELKAASKLGFENAVMIEIQTALPQFQAIAGIWSTKAEPFEKIQNIELRGNTLDLLGFETALAHKLAVYFGSPDDQTLAQWTRRAPTFNNAAYLTHYEGMAYLEKRQHEEALVRFRRAQQLDPEYRAPKVMEGETYRQQASVLLDANPDETLALLDKAIGILHGLGEYRSQAEAYLLQSDAYAKKAETDNAREAAHNAARCYLLVGEAELATGILVGLKTKGQANAETHYLHGLAMLRVRVEGELPGDAALRHFTAAIELDELHPEAHYQRARLLKQRASANLQQGNAEQASRELAEAARDLTVATTVKPNWWEPLYELGEVFRLNGSPRDAVDYYDEALRVLADTGKPIDRTVCLQGKAKALKDLNLLNEAAAALQQAIEITPEHVPPWFDIIITYTDLAKYDAAREWLRKARTQFNIPEERSGRPGFLELKLIQLANLVDEHENKGAGQERPRPHFDPTNPERFGGRHEAPLPPREEK